MEIGKDGTFGGIFGCLGLGTLGSEELMIWSLQKSMSGHWVLSAPHPHQGDVFFVFSFFP